LMSEVLGVPVASGTLAGLTGEAAGRLGGFGEVVRAALRAEPVIGADETGARVAGRVAWVHTASTPRLTWQSVHAKRGTDGIDAGGVLLGYPGVVVHDDWAPYRSYTDATHALCGAHLVRVLAAVAKTPVSSGQVGCGRYCWRPPGAPPLPARPGRPSWNPTPWRASPAATSG
jgi:transposase